MPGSAKTTTAIGFCKARPTKRVLYIVYNSSMAKEAKVDFKGVHNVTIKTTHGLAWFPYGKRYNDAKKLLTTGSYKVYDLNRDLSLDDFEFAGKLMNIWNKYLVSNSKSIDEFCDNYFSKKSNYKDRVNYNLKKLWNMKKDLDSGVMVEHNFYLKEFHLSGFKTVSGYDILICDEKQDSSELVQDIFESSDCEQKLALGDSLQQIYQFNNAINALKNIKGKRYPLTKSFRVNQSTADICNLLFKHFGESEIDMQGMNKSQNTFRRQIKPNQLDKCAIICRTNAMVFGNALEMSLDRKIYFEGGVQGYKFDFYNKLWFFKCGKEVKDRMLNKFENYIRLVEYAEESEDIELLSAIGIVKMYNRHIPDGVKRIYESTVNRKSDADVILTTAHKSKGQTYRIPVIIENDFDDIVDFQRIKFAIKYGGLNDKIKKSMQDDMLESLNLIYVAITRAFDDLYLNESLIKWLLKLDIEKETGVES